MATDNTPRPGGGAGYSRPLCFLFPRPSLAHKDRPLKSASATTFDEAYYQRFYFDTLLSGKSPGKLAQT